MINLELDPRHLLLEVCAGHPLMLAAMTHVLGAGSVLKKMHCRSPLPGGGHQGLHSDLQNPPVPGRWLEAQATWCIRALTEHNGATRVIPGSHLSSDPPIGEEFGAGMKPHPREVKLLGGPGTLIIYNAQLWHSGTFNYSAHPRLAVAVRFGRQKSGNETAT